MKICIINNIFDPFSRGGADKIAKLCKEIFINRQHDVFIISTRPWFNKAQRDNIYYLPSLFNKLNRIPKILRIFWHIWDCFNLINYLKIKKILQKEKPDLVFTHNTKGIGSLLFVLLSQLKIKHIHTLHDIQLIHPSGLMFYKQENILKSRLTKIYILINKNLTKNIPIIISPSDWLLNLHKQHGFFQKAKTQKILNPIKITRLTDHKKRKNNFLFVGELTDSKGIIFLIKSFIEFNANGQFKLLIAGEGEKESEVLDFCSKYNYLEYLGKKTNKEILEIMQESIGLLIGSVCYENSPAIIYEAASRSLPVIAPDIGGVKELVDIFGGICFTPLNRLELINSIKKLINNYNFYQNKIQENFPDLEDIYYKKISDLIK